MLESIDGYRIDIKWALRFLGLASYISKWSKDPSTKVGAVIAQGNRIVSLGYNGFPASCRRERHPVCQTLTSWMYAVREQNSMP